MSRRVVTYVEVTCNLCKKQVKEDDATTVLFTWAKTNYTLDVCPKDYKHLSEFNIGVLVNEADKVPKNARKVSAKAAAPAVKATAAPDSDIPRTPSGKKSTSKWAKYLDPDAGRYRCPDPSCGRDFTTPQGLGKHAITHDDQDWLSSAEQSVA